MPSVSTPLGTTQPYIPATSQSQLGRYAGLHMHFATLTALNAAITDERTNVTNAAAIWQDGQVFTVATEAPAGVHRTWSVSLNHGRTVHLGSGRSVVLAADSNTVLLSAGTPGNGLGSNGDLCVDSTNGNFRLKSGGAWGTATPVVAPMAGADIVAAIDTQLGGPTWQGGGGGGGSVTVGDITDMSANARSFNQAGNYAAMRTAISLTPGTDVQAFNTKLASIAGLTTSADTLAYFTSSSAAALTSFTAGGRALVNSAGTAGTFPYFSSSNTVTLASITAAGLAMLSAANSGAQLTALGLSANGSTLVTQSNYSAMRTVLSLVPGTDIDAFAATASQAEAEAGTSTLVRNWTPQRIAQAIATLAPGGGGGGGAPVIEAMPTGSPYTLVTGDANKIKRGVDTNPQTVNITTAFNGLAITIQWPAGAGTITLDAAAGVNLNGLGDAVNIVLSQAAGAVDLIPTGTNTWDVVGAIGDLVATDVTDSTTIGRTILTAADAAAVRTATGLVIGTNVQAQDAKLQAIAGLTAAADRLAYFTGASAAAVTNLTAAGRALIDSAGTANTMPYFSASNVVTLQSLTAAGRALLDDADATAQLTTLGLTADARSLVTAANYAAMRTLLGLVIGTNVQAQDPFLAKLAAAVPRELNTAVTLGGTDVDCTLRANSGSTFVITLANDSTLTPVVGKSTITVFIQGLGVPTFAAGTGTLLGSPRSGLAQNDTIVLVHTGVANTWAYA